ncbi:PTH2-domain-containing protein [Annulohypoxylon truncatum]|uniref:PTH2-domain-containing protein n=1 Tax=Annulohypoxylon truncatum TaxID=327061 RepID=UPI0020086597|nr:PTH2-domain-containing protein [Annulohypoxylon truncatum]KAI1210590.1 PTH2-domain-containing protein [Annulohypoxylon truncatum]
MADKSSSLLLAPSSMIVATSIVTFLTGFMFGVYSIRGYLFVSPALASERRSNVDDPVESEESDIDDDTILDHAPNWANGEDADQRDGLRMPKQKKSKKATKAEEKDDKEDVIPLADAPANEECKLVLVVRTDLGMTKGKIAAQCSHATLACYKTLTKAASRNPSSPEAKLLQRWERRGQAKIAVQLKSEDELLELMGKARSLGITAEVIQDAGRTQIDPGSLTVLGVGPAPKSLVDRVTGGLKLL